MDTSSGGFLESILRFLAESQTPTGGVFTLCLIILTLGIVTITKLNKDSPLAGSAFQVLTMLILIPAAMFMGVAKIISAEAVTGIFGSIAGYVFARVTDKTPTTTPPP